MKFTQEQLEHLKDIMVNFMVDHAEDYDKIIQELYQYIVDNN